MKKCEINTLKDQMPDLMYGRLLMLKERLEQLLFDKELYEFCTNVGDVEVVNPTVTFARRAKCGCYDDLSDGMYKALLDDVEELAKPFHDEDVVRLSYKAMHYELLRHMTNLLELVTKLVDANSFVDDLQRICAMQEERDEVMHQLFGSENASEIAGELFDEDVVSESEELAENIFTDFAEDK